MSIYRAVLLLCALMLVPVIALAQERGPFVRDDLSGTLNDYYINKSAGIGDGVGARLRFDIDYEYKASLLMGEPVVVCSANIRDPQGEISFRYDDGFYTVTINEENAKLLTPYNVDFAITYKSLHADNAIFLARCNAGIPGSWTYDALNVPSSPDWDNFLCWAAGSGFQKPNPMPDSLPDDWCRAFGQGGGRTLDEDEAKKRFAVTPASDGGAITRAVEVDVAAFGINYVDLIAAEIRKISADKIAERKFEQVRQVRNTLHQSQGASAQAARQLDEAMRDANAIDDSREQARMLQGAMRDVLNIEPSQQDAQAFVELRTFILHLLSSDDERSFVSAIKQTLTDLQDATDQSAQAVEETFDMHRADAANAPQFTFAELEDEPVAQAATGPADITHQIKHFEGHDGWPIMHLTFHPDGKRIASAGWDDTIRIWDIESGRELHRFENPGSRAMAFSPDGRWLAGGSRSGDVNIWDVETGQLTNRLVERVGSIDSVAISPDGRFLFSGTSTGAVLWDFENGRVVRYLSRQSGTAHFGTFSLNSDMVIFRWAGGISWHDIASEKTVTMSVGGEMHLHIDPYAGGGSGTNIVEAGEHYVGLFTLEGSGQDFRRLEKPGAFSISPSPDGRYILIGGREGLVGIMDREAGDAVRNVGVHSMHQSQHASQYRDGRFASAVYSVAFSPDGSFAVSSGADGMIRVWGP